MKRYAIVYADGSNRRLTQTDYPSRKEAGNALIHFLTCNNASCSKDDDEYLNPFDFTLKEVEYMTWDTKAPKKPRRCVRHKYMKFKSQNYVEQSSSYQMITRPQVRRNYIS